MFDVYFFNGFASQKFKKCFKKSTCQIAIYVNFDIIRAGQPQPPRDRSDALQNKIEK